MQVSSFRNGDSEGTLPHIRREVSEHSIGAQSMSVIGMVATNRSVLTYCEVSLMLPILQLGKLRLRRLATLSSIFHLVSVKAGIPTGFPGPGACWWLSVPCCLNVPSALLPSDSHGGVAPFWVLRAGGGFLLDELGQRLVWRLGRPAPV